MGDCTGKSCLLTCIFIHHLFLYKWLQISLGVVWPGLSSGQYHHYCHAVVIHRILDPLVLMPAPSTEAVSVHLVVLSGDRQGLSDKCFVSELFLQPPVGTLKMFDFVPTFIISHGLVCGFLA